MASITKQFFHHVLPGIMRPIRVLWNEVIGFVFLVFGALAAYQVFRASREYQGDPDAFFRLVLSAVFSLVMLGFGVQSFLRARKISRS